MRWAGLASLTMVLLSGILLLGLGGTHALAQAPAVGNIDELTRQARVVSYVREHQHLPGYYITKQQARAAGWDAREGNLCQVLPGKAIGGDRFGNREQKLPHKKGRVWREADIDYRCGHRGAARLIYSNDGLLYVTRDHYRRFQRME